MRPVAAGCDSAGMTVMSREIDEALKEAKVSETTALKAAEAVAAIADAPRRPDRVETRLDRIESELVDVKADTRLLKWMASFNLAASMGVVWLLLRTMLK